jgi:hypothetical protein
MQQMTPSYELALELGENVPVASAESAPMQLFIIGAQWRTQEIAKRGAIFAATKSLRFFFFSLTDPNPISSSLKGGGPSARPPVFLSSSSRQK